MNEIAKIGVLFRNEVGDDVFDALSRIFPEGVHGASQNGFYAVLQANDARTSAILSILDNAGLRPWVSNGHMPVRGKDYILHYQRVYESADLLNYECIELCPLGEGRIEKGQARSITQSTTVIREPGRIEMCRIGPSSSFVTVQRARDALEAAGLQGLKFRPVIKQYNSIDYDLYDEDDTWWEIDTDIVLPPVSPSMTLLTRHHQPHPRDLSEGCYRREGFYLLPELYYRRADIERLAPFDVARTYEYFGAPTPFDRAMVVSRRFYEVCLEHNIRSHWIPVHLED